MNKKIFEAMRIGIFELLMAIKEMVLGLMRFLLGLVVWFSPVFVIVMIAKYIFPNSPEDAFACSLVLCLPAFIFGAALVGELQHVCRTIQYIKEHDCEAREAWEATKPKGSCS